MIYLTTQNGMKLALDEYDFIKVERNNIFTEIPATELAHTDKLFFYYKKYFDHFKNDLSYENINMFAFLLSNMTYEKEEFYLTINESKFNIYKKLFNVKSIRRNKTKIILSFTNSDNKIYNDFLTILKKEKNILKKYFKNNLGNFKMLMNNILMKESIYKKEHLELVFSEPVLEELQLILLSLKIKSKFINNKLEIKDKHSLLRVLEYFNINNNLKKLKTMLKDTELDYLYIGENQTFFLTKIKEIKKDLK